ncbi:hypothetical protein BKA66DRAFT_581139 [Pyrenochaeta sp. MPI-SDFR-AT-0127]|nr:hypothetical protein BKA66DRAFT_581139 [Pyrenochaeta sp. MPI-SDFR-AT-0127]
MRLLDYIVPWFVVAHLSLSLTLPPSIKLYKRALSDANFEDRIRTSDDTRRDDPFWRQELEETLQVVRLLAENARQVPWGHELGREWFGGDDFYNLRTRIFDTIIDIIDNPAPHFRIIRTRPSIGLPAGAAAQHYHGQWVDGIYPELTGGARRAAVIHLYPTFWRLRELFQDVPLVAPGEARISFDLNTRAAALFHEASRHVQNSKIKRQLTFAEGHRFNAEFLNNLDNSSEDHPNEDTQDDGSSSTYPDQPDIERYSEMTGEIIEDLVPEHFLTTHDGNVRTFLDSIAPQDDIRPVAYDAIRVQTVPHMHHGQMVAAMNAQNYAAFAITAFRNLPIPEVDDEDPYGDLQAAIDFAGGVGAPPSPNIRAGEGWPNLNPDLQTIGVRYMLAATEIWLDYDQLGSDFLKKSV